MSAQANPPLALELVKLLVSPEREAEFLRDRPAAIEALRRANPGLRSARLFRSEEPGVWYDVLFWDSLDEAREADAHAAELPEAAAWFAHIDEPDIRHGTLVHALGDDAP